MPWTCPTCKHVFDVGPSVPITPPEAHAEAGELSNAGLLSKETYDSLVRDAMLWRHQQSRPAPAGTDKLLSMARSWQEEIEQWEPGTYHDVALQMVGELRALAAGTEGPGLRQKLLDCKFTAKRALLSEAGGSLTVGLQKVMEIVDAALSASPPLDKSPGIPRGRPTTKSPPRSMHDAVYHEGRTEEASDEQKT